MQHSDDMNEMIERLGDALRERGWFASTAESCTGGLVAHLLTNVPGSSEWFLGGVVAYANEVKTGLLGVPEAVLRAHGAVSRETVLAMVEGLCPLVKAHCGVAVSGIAGPGGGTPDKPVGTVWMAWNVNGARNAQVFHFEGGRDAIKAATARQAIAGLLERVTHG
ncbi:nicotinamide-nucleotide amidase [Desulfobaculum xiamenense]|uniref:Nicotinamide-nucleotide amidase n=1 Tax=Desulfobaculum xiamenense TaxID=995050 RepID=A0A846QLZ2_9BACT|nr:CinA family protein [Desulfobaculum xiamenense]NJB68207.1 nicotinamide-nucleotide amidase [Desulfobaculum xiamenense]